MSGQALGFRDSGSGLPCWPYCPVCAVNTASRIVWSWPVRQSWRLGPGLVCSMQASGSVRAQGGWNRCGREGRMIEGASVQGP